ncbi:30S ribosomal protein S5 [Candidatus Dojkabacteria bacterium]|uniref:Small ribosomal subunit protein uS5 n=1 Tax=Candidatus Dojkabacteria bacterium TaxID=2099670 RepID=A0A955I7K3_9BACT|nr:30S ribosomal protein S5 [Candidatus Dojkabacteria bacterium]
MSENNDTKVQTTVAEEVAKTQTPQQSEKFESKYEQKRRLARSRSRDRKPRGRREDDEFDSRLISIRRVSRMYKGGRRMRMSVVVIAGDKKGRVGIGLGKGADVSLAQSKAMEHAKRNLVMVPLKGNTIPHEVMHKYRSSKIMLKPAAPGTGLVAGATVKAVLELAGVKDILSKSLGSNNQINVAQAVIEALQTLRVTRL